MTNHDDCRRATFTASTDPTSPFAGEWRCYHCGERLAMATRFGQVEVDARMIETAKRIDGLVTYGLPEKYRTTSRARIPRSGSYLGPRHLPLAIHCPRPGICGRVQHCHLDDSLGARLA